MSEKIQRWRNGEFFCGFLGLHLTANLLLLLEVKEGCGR
jgi:hypothetical protein